MAAALLTERELEIKLAIASSTDRLDLSDCQLDELPAALWQLSGLVELSLAGNQLQQLPASVAALSNLQRLVLAGNRLEQLPQELCGLTALRGLWAHGNELQALPAQLGQLTGLTALSLAGNRLSELPDSLTCLVKLEDLNLSGNQLAALPDGVTALTALRKFSAHGNRLQQLPQAGWQQLTQLDELCLQGNELSELPDSLAQLQALTELSLADNRITQLPTNLRGLSSLRKAHLYGNQLTQLPLGPDGLPALLLPPAPDSGSGSGSGSDGLDEQPARARDSGAGSGPQLASLWLEANPLSPGCVSQLLQLLAPPAGGADGSASDARASSSGRSSLPRVGLDDSQLSGSAGEEWERQAAAAGGATILRRGIVKGEGPGYFKLQLGPGGSAQPDAGRVLVVAFGSAPGLPNWGGVLRKVYAAAEDAQQSCFDVLYVVDPHRSWYCGGAPQRMAQRYSSRLARYTAGYSGVVMVGDSMGASAALLFAPLATSVLSFCPQVRTPTALRRRASGPGHVVHSARRVGRVVRPAAGRAAARGGRQRRADHCVHWHVAARRGPGQAAGAPRQRADQGAQRGLAPPGARAGGPRQAGAAAA